MWKHHQKILCFLLVAGLSYSAYATEKPTITKALVTLQNQNSLETLLSLLKTNMNPTDHTYLVSSFNVLNFDKSAPLSVFARGSNRFELPGLKGVFEIRFNGAEVLYAGTLYRFNKKMDFQKNIESFAAKIAKTSHLNEWDLLPAIDSVTHKSFETALLVGTVLKYVSRFIQWDGKAYRAQAVISTDGALYALLKNDSHISNLKCQKRRAGETPKVYFVHTDGSTREVPAEHTVGLSAFCNESPRVFQTVLQSLQNI